MCDRRDQSVGDGYRAAAKAPDWVDFRSGFGTLPACGKDTLTIARSGDIVSIRVRERELLQYVNTKPAARVEVSFGHLPGLGAKSSELRAHGLTGFVTLEP